MWLRVLENPVFILCVMREASVLFGATACLTRRQCCGLDDQAIIDQFLGRKSFHMSSKHPDSLQGEPSPAIHSVRIQGKAAGSDSKLLISV